MTTIGLLLAGAGVVLMYTGVKGDDLPSVIIKAFTHPSTPAPAKESGRAKRATSGKAKAI